MRNSPPKKRDDILTDYIDDLLEIGRAGSTAAVVKKAVVSWLDWNGKKLNRSIKIPNAHATPTLKDAHIPLLEEFKRTLNVCDARSRCAIGLIAFAGLREEVMGNYEGTDGLRVEHFPEARIEDGIIVFDTIPTRIEVPEELSKNGRPYFTFLGPEGCAYITDFSVERKQRGEKLTLKSSIIKPKWAKKSFMRSTNVGDLIRRPMRAAGLQEPPYIWRSYFSSRAMLAEGKGFTRDYRVFCMGHAGDIEHVYALHKKLPPDTVEAMRKGYENALEFLETATVERGEDPTVRLLSVLLQAAGYTEDDLKALDLANRTEEEIVEILRNGLKERQAPEGYNSEAPALPAPPIQRIIPLTGLDDALQEGWLFRHALPDGRAVIKSGPQSGNQPVPSTG